MTKGSKGSSSVVNFNNSEVCFSFKYFHTDLTNNKKVHPNETKALIEQLKSLSKMTWQQVYNSGRHGLGSERISEKDDELTKIVQKQDKNIKDDLKAIAYKI